MNKRASLEKLLERAGLLKAVVARLDSPLEVLSMRELQILMAISAGSNPAEASEMLKISPKSFSTYRARVLEKLGLKSNAELAVLAFELGMVPSVLERLRSTGHEQAT